MRDGQGSYQLTNEALFEGFPNLPSGSGRPGRESGYLPVSLLSLVKGVGQPLRGRWRGRHPNHLCAGLRCACLPFWQGRARPWMYGWP